MRESLLLPVPVLRASLVTFIHLRDPESTGMLHFPYQSIFRLYFAPWADAASGTLLAYDYLCTFDIELSYVWAGPWTWGKYLFLLNRYLPFVDTFIHISLNVGNPSPNRCLIQQKVATWFMVIGITIAEVILMLRTYGIWERRRSILITLIGNFLLTCVPALVVTQLHLDALHYRHSPYPGIQHCSSSSVGPIIIVAYILLVCSETLIVTLTMIKAFQRFRLHSSRPTWLFQLFHDGFIFYIYILCLSMLSILLPFLVSPAFLDVLSVPLRVLHSILCTRVLFVIFRLRSVNDSTSTSTFI